RRRHTRFSRDWSSDVCSSDLKNLKFRGGEVEFVYQPDTHFNATFNVAFIDGRFDNSSASQAGGTSIYNLYALGAGPGGLGNGLEIGRASCRERVEMWVGTVSR